MIVLTPTDSGMESTFQSTVPVLALRVAVPELPVSVAHVMFAMRRLSDAVPAMLSVLAVVL